MSRLIDADALKKALKTLSFPIELDSNVMTMFTHDVVNAITNAPTVQREGWVSVPIKPTREMLEAAKLEQADHGSYEEWIDYGYGEDVIANYKAMLSAAPSDKE